MERLWSILGKRTSLLFGEECFSSFLWMTYSLLGRFILVLMHFDSDAIAGFICCILPLYQYTKNSSGQSIIRSISPLPVRLAESMMGRLKPKELSVVIPAHVFGSILSIICFSTITSFFPGLSDALFHLKSSEAYSLSGFVKEVLVATFFIVVLIIVPQILEVNRLNPTLVCVPIVPISFFSASTFQFNPCALYTLWLTSNGPVWIQFTKKIARMIPFLSTAIQGFYGDSSIEIQPSERTYLPTGHILASIFAAILAGILCNYFFPDDPSSWVRLR